MRRLILGSAQFGSTYGIVNRGGSPSDDALDAILRAAAIAGIEWIDTARAYGKAEERLGPRIEAGGWKVITKIAPIDQVAKASAERQMLDSLARSHAALGRDWLDVVLFHRSEDALHEGGRLTELLADRAKNGTIGRIGLSVYCPDEALACLADTSITIIQLPFNLLDARWLDSAFQQALAKRPDVEIHARSTFLQGLLISPADRWPSWVPNSGEIVDMIAAMAAQSHCSIEALCLRYTLSQPWINKVVFGVEDVHQLSEIVAAADDLPLGPSSLAMLTELRRRVPLGLEDPSHWASRG